MNKETKKFCVIKGKLLVMRDELRELKQEQLEGEHFRDVQVVLSLLDASMRLVYGKLPGDQRQE